MANQSSAPLHSFVEEGNRKLPPVRLYPSQHRVSMTRYATSTDPRGYIPVFEYPLNGQYIMIDCETGMVHFTGIWKALGHTKADVVKLVESDPTIAPHLRKVRGGYLKIQGTWLPFETAQTLARRVAWQVRYDLIPLFGPDFPDTCLAPGELGFGQLLLSAPKPRGRRGAKKTTDTTLSSTASRAPGPSGPAEARPSILSNTYSLGDGSRVRPSHRTDAIGPLGAHPSTMAQSRYSPYGRVASHGITQLEPLPNLVNPPAGHLYTNQFQQLQSRPLLMPSSGTSMSTFDSCINPPPPSAGSTTPTPADNQQTNSPPSNFFETYRGPDSFEALSNRWLASQSTNTSGVLNPTLFTNESNCFPRMPYYSQVASRNEQLGSTFNQCDFSSSLDPLQSNFNRASNPPHTVDRISGYYFDQPYTANFSQDLMGGHIERKLSSPSEYPTTNTTFNNSFSSDTNCKSQSHHPQSSCSSNYINSHPSTNPNLTGSPSSHSSHNAQRSPSPSVASTSTTANQSRACHSQRSSQNTISGFSQCGSYDPRSEDLNHFSVLTSPASLEISNSIENHTTTAYNSESGWDSLQNSVAMSPIQTFSS
ncbi:hypothetical protein O181_033558 [Austropuccinia psidii MF-1]|uniref:HTH APSES-type domain-containing protein n=1 Tax=Austropuccinia psidii MF-1 TaxID=1389203 RepID=A0A9Q3D3T5_9BASI|nr:hypothetical protein [Austropuccinia psidii MF-1]